MAEKINSIDELERMKAAANAQGATVPNYQEWSQIMKDLDEAGVQSTGSYQGDKALHSEISKTIEQYMEQQKVEQAQQVKKTQEDQPKKIAESDNEQALKATVANATSSMILSDYMKYYHLIS
ncbi:MAG: hypothetical protein E7Z93_04690 [Cyanobacteria bacterium SIG32]|nr:hypothetical protein [Cyanobacteria bacterium SIG32]